MIVGIDPGKTGALVILDGMEIVKKLAFDGLTGFQIYDSILRLKTVYARNLEMKVFKESFASYGIDGRVSFTVGYQHGIIDLACLAASLNKTDVTPNTWVKKIYNDEKSDLKPKARNLIKARELFGSEALIVNGKKKPHMGVTDALLIAYYGTLN